MKQRSLKVSKRVYSNPAVVDLVELHQEVSQDPEEIIRHLARNEITDARNYGLSGPPFDPRILASIMGIQHEASKQLIRSEDAELQPIGKDNRDLIIKYNPDKPKTRQNFSIAHEIAHTLFPEYRDQYKAHHKIGKFNPGSEVEFLCDLGASEIIMPTPEFNRDVEKMGISLKSLERLSKHYNASLEATAIRMITTNFDSCALMVLGYSHKPSELRQSDCLWLLPMKLRVQYFVRSKYFFAYIPKHKSIKESSPLHEVSVTRKPFEGNIIFDFTTPTLDIYVEAVALPGTHNADFDSRVLVFLFQ